MTCLLLAVCIAFATPAYTVDRFEGEVAVLEVAGGRLVDMPRRQLPADAAEGDVLTAFFTIDHEATAERRRLMADLHRRIAR